MTGDMPGVNVESLAGVRSPSMADTPRVVVGKRRSFLLGQSWKEFAWELAGPLLLWWSVRWFIALFREGHLFDDDHFGHTVAGGLFFAFITLVGGIGVAGLISSLGDLVLDSACPCCGAERRRNFRHPSSSPPVECGACLAYLCANGLEVAEVTEVTEERLNGNKRFATPYELSSQHYLPAVRRDNHNHFRFRWPEMCATCGATATQRRDIGKWGQIQTDLGILGEVVHIVGVEAGVAPRRDSEMVHHIPSSTSKTNTEKLDSELSNLEVPVCSKHTEVEDRFAPPLEFKSGKLLFASYIYYKAFCELNEIGATSKSVTNAPGVPPASRSQ